MYQQSHCREQAKQAEALKNKLRVTEEQLVNSSLTTIKAVPLRTKVSELNRTVDEQRRKLDALEQEKRAVLEKTDELLTRLLAQDALQAAAEALRREKREFELKQLDIASKMQADKRRVLESKQQLDDFKLQVLKAEIAELEKQCAFLLEKNTMLSQSIDRAGEAQATAEGSLYRVASDGNLYDNPNVTVSTPVRVLVRGLDQTGIGAGGIATASATPTATVQRVLPRRHSSYNLLCVPCFSGALPVDLSPDTSAAPPHVHSPSSSSPVSNATAAAAVAAAIAAAATRSPPSPLSLSPPSSSLSSPLPLLVPLSSSSAVASQSPNRLHLRNLSIASMFMKALKEEQTDGESEKATGTRTETGMGIIKTQKVDRQFGRGTERRISWNLEPTALTTDNMSERNSSGRHTSWNSETSRVSSIV